MLQLPKQHMVLKVFLKKGITCRYHNMWLKEALTWNTPTRAHMYCEVVKRNFEK